ncbi:MAG: N-6 DNA methylase [Myxococcales bacterium]|nr:N-6 DNA methylase [Myxococcales bacterium]
MSGGAADAHEQSLARAVRRSLGVFYTPPAVAERLAGDAIDRVLRRLPPGAVKLFDPACGSGNLLIAGYRRLLQAHAQAGSRIDAEGRRRIVEGSIFGVDVDAEAVARAREALAQAAGVAVDLSANVRVGDAIREHERREFSVLLANPPYLDAETMTRHHAALRAFCHGRYAAASGNWDLFCVFVERCLQLCAPGGSCALLVPNKLASADYARAARGLLVTNGWRLRLVRDLQAVPVFAAGIYPIAVLVEHGGEDGGVVVERMTGIDEVAERVVVPAERFADPSRPWPLYAGEAARVVARIEAAGRPLGTIAEVHGAATVAEAYAIAGLVREGERGLRIVNSGTIDPYTPLWGVKPMRYLGASYVRPVIPDELQAMLPARRLAEARRPKVVVSGMTRELEAVLDSDGEYLAGKSTTIVSGSRIDLRVIVAVLNSEVMRGYYRNVYAADRLAGGYLRVGPPQLSRLPVAEFAGQAAGRIINLVEARVAGAVAVTRAIDEAVAEGYGVTSADVQALAR